MTMRTPNDTPQHAVPALAEDRMIVVIDANEREDEDDLTED